MSGGKMIRKLLILLCLLTLMLNGCASEKIKQTAAQENDTEEDSGEKKIQIGLTVDSFVIERWIRDRDAFVATARMREQIQKSRSARSTILSRSIWM